MRHIYPWGVLLFLAWLPGSTAADTPNSQPSAKPTFEKADRNHDGELSLDETIAAGMDDLTYRAMDLNGDGLISKEEYARHRALENQLPGK